MLVQFSKQQEASLVFPGESVSSLTIASERAESWPYGGEAVLYSILDYYGVLRVLRI
jgi:hypothetical protein